MSAGENDTSTLNSADMDACIEAISSVLPKPLSTMLEPAAAKARAMPSPIPLVDPVTIDTLPASARTVLSVGCLTATVMGELPCNSHQQREGWCLMRTTLPKGIGRWKC